MRLNSLHLCNFRQHLDTRIEFEPGITGIIGPNGSGKSTILEAIAWALYGMPAARGTRESIRSYRASPRAAVKVELDFELSGHRYQVTRGLTSAELYLDGATQPIATSISGVTELLRRRLGMSHEEFFNTYFTGQKELSVMAAMGPAERAQFLSRVLGYERLRTAQALVRDRRKAIIAEMSGLRAGMADPDAVNQALVLAETRVAAAERRARDAAEQCEKCRRALDVVTPRWESVQRERDAMQAITAELRVVDGERTALARDAERVARELADAAGARRELDRLTVELAPLPAMQLELSALDRACNEAERRRTLVDTERSLTEEIARLDERISKIETAPSLEPDVTQQLAQARTELEQTQREFEDAQGDWIRDKQEAETKRQSLLDQLRDVQKQREQIVELGEGGTCPICARPLGTHFRSVLEVLDTQIETITVDGKYFRARIEQLDALPPEIKALDERRRLLFENVGKLERRLAKIQAAVQELGALRQDLTTKRERQAAVLAELETISVSYDAVRHGEVRAAVERLTPLAAQATKLMTQLEREPGLLSERERVRVASEQLEARGADLVLKQEALQFSEASFTEMRERYERAAAELRAGELGAVAADAELASARASLEAADRARAELARNEEHLGLLGRERRLHDELDRVFSDLRTDLNQALRPEISDLASRYIRELTDGRYTELELDDQYNVIVLEDAIPKPVISGGEEDLANLVLRLSISEMIAERAGQAFSLLILDEVFGSLDEARRHNVVDLLRRLQDRFEQVILITHIESVREGLDRVVTVRYDEETGSSRVETESRSEALPDVHAGAAD
ncbi:MAG TPA: SMC family ATPase [Gemmatimonadaceae bacterium]|nr:SMC family ATPase [Gemmatimonadaceae bacterium]